MNPDWKVFLQENGAEFVTNSGANSNDTTASEKLVSFGHPGIEMQISSQDVLLSNASERGLIKVNG